MYLNSVFVEKTLSVAVADELPHEGVNFLLCNDAAGDGWGPDGVACSKPGVSNM